MPRKRCRILEDYEKAERDYALTADASEEIDFENLTGTEWVELLIERPECADKCDWAKLTDEDWHGRAGW